MAMFSQNAQPGRPAWRRAAFVAALFGASLLSCGREITGPENGVGTRYAHGLSFLTEFPGPLASVEAGAGSVVPFSRVRVLFRREDGSPALDQLVDFPENEDEIELSLSVPLSRSASPEGETLQLYLRYINATGDTVFSGGPVPVLAVPTRRGSPPPQPANVPVTYTGPGANATSVSIAQDTIFVNAGASFNVTATALDDEDEPVSDAPLIWSVLDAPKLTLPNIATGSFTAGATRGPARLRVALAAGGAGTGWADTAIVMIAPVPSALQLVSGGAQTGDVGQPLADSIVIQLNATDGAPLADHWVHFSTDVVNSSVSADSLLTDVNGRVTLEWTLGSLAGPQTLTAAVHGIAALQVSATAEANLPTQLAVVTAPEEVVVAGIFFTPAVIEVRTAADVLWPDYTDSVRVSISSGPLGGTIYGRLAVVPVDGVATFDSLFSERAGTYLLEFSANGLTPVNALVTVTPAPPAALETVSGDSQFVQPGTTLPEPIVVRLRDVYDNPIPGRAIAASVITAGGSVTPDTAVTDADGQVSVTWTLANAAGSQQLRFNVPETSLSALDVFANEGAGEIVATNVSPGTDTLEYLGETRQFSASSVNAALSVIVGSYTWESLDDTVATVDGNGLVTAVANGSARIVATEAGGTADTAIVVVRQAVASVTITPDVRDIYLGANFTFTAQAVDGGGAPMAEQLPIAWSVQNASIASVDSLGFVTGTGLGTTQLRATIGGVQGVAEVTIRTPITRIAVIRDSTGFVQTDTFTVAALLRTRSYRAIAYDTLDAPMSGISFVFESSNPAVASPDSVGSETIRVRALANGNANIRATAQGVTGAALLQVQQQLDRLELSPSTVQVGPGGSYLLTARGRDPDGHYLPSVSGVTYNSLQSAIATVNPTTGVVTGVAIGTALVTAERSGILADTVVVTVGESVPAVISFGRDSLAIGRSGSQSIPIYLSRPSASPVTVLLAVADTFAYFSQGSITIGAGATSGNATLNGRNAGVTQISAVDGSTNTVYAGDTARLAVQANVRFTNGSYTIVTYQQVATQVLLSDPAPPGGAYISFEHGTPGRVEVSPEPAFIPAGQLAANVVLTGLAGGGTTLTPLTTGATGQTANITTHPPKLDLSGTSYRLGLGQQRADLYLQAPSNLQFPQVVQLTSSDTSVLRVPAQVTIPAGTYYAYFQIQAAGPNTGSVIIRATASGWDSDSVAVTVTSPKVDICCNASLTTTSPTQSFSISSLDSANAVHARITPLVVALEASDPSIVQLSQETGTIAAGSSSRSGLQYTLTGQPGTAWIRASAPGHGVDSISVTVVGPKLSFSAANARVGAGQMNSGVYLSVPNNVTSPLPITLTSTNTGATLVPDTTTIPNGTYYRYFTFYGLQAGVDSIIASAPGYQPDTIELRVNTPSLGMTNLTTYDNYRPPFNITLTTRDSIGTAYAVTDSVQVTLTSSNPDVATVTPTAWIVPGASQVSNVQVTIVGEGETEITATAPGYRSISDTLFVRTPKLSFNFSTFRIGRRQRSSASQLYVSVPNNLSETLPVTITHLNLGIDSLLSSADIPGDTYYRYFSLAGLELGVDTLIATAPGYLPDTAIIEVNSPRFSVTNLTGTLTTTTPPRSLTIYSTNENGTQFAPLEDLVVNVISSDPSVLQPVSSTVTIPSTATSVSTQIAVVGPGQAFIYVADSAGNGYTGDTTNTVTVTGPSLSLTNSTPKLGIRQHNGTNGAYVSVPNNIVGQPLVVHLTSSDPTAVAVQDSVIIPVGTYYAYFSVRADTIVSTVQITATAPGYGTATMLQQVTAARFIVSINGSLRSTQAPATFSVWTTDADGSAHPTTEDVVVTLTSSDPSVASFTTATVTIPANASFSNVARVKAHSVGTIQLSASDARTAGWRYVQGSTNVSVIQPTLALNWSTQRIGVGQYVTRAVSVPDAQRPRVLATLTNRHGRAITPDTVNVDSTQTARNFILRGVALGADTIRVTSPGYNPDSGYVSVELGTIGTPTGWPTAISTDSVQVTLRTRGPDGTINRVSEPTTFTLSVDANLVFHVGGQQVSSVTVPADSDTVTFWLRRVSAGTANVTISNANYQTFTSAVTVNAP